MPHCAAVGCTNESSSKSNALLELEKKKKITFHSFPKNNNKRKLWIDRMRLTEASLPKFPQLCSCHFSDESFNRTSACKISLKDIAVPSISKVHNVSNVATNRDIVVQREANSVNIGEQTIKLEQTVQNRTCTIDEEEESTNEIGKQHDINTVEETIHLKRPRANEGLTENVVDEQIRKKPRIVDSSTNYYTTDASTQTPPQSQSVDKVTWVSRSLLANSPTKMHLRNIVQDQKVSYERQIRLLKQTTRRKQERITSLKNLLTELKKHTQLTDNELNVLRNMAMSTKDLLK